MGLSPRTQGLPHFTGFPVPPGRKASPLETIPQQRVHDPGRFVPGDVHLRLTLKVESLSIQGSRLLDGDSHSHGLKAMWLSPKLALRVKFLTVR